jgi:GTP-binding protein EngB required for normal cell division
LTKIDKLSSGERATRMHDVCVNLALESDQVIAFSAVTGEGRNDLGEAIDSLLAQPSWREAAP